MMGKRMGSSVTGCPQQFPSVVMAILILLAGAAALAGDADSVAGSQWDIDSVGGSAEDRDGVDGSLGDLDGAFGYLAMRGAYKLDSGRSGAGDAEGIGGRRWNQYALTTDPNEFWFVMSTVGVWRLR